MEHLIKRLDGLCSRERERAVAGWAREAGQKDIDTALEALVEGKAFERRMAVVIASLSGRHELALRSLEDPSLQVRCAAVAQMAARCRSSRAVVDAALKAAPATRVALARSVSRLKRRDLAQPLAEVFLELNDLRAARPLLEWCDAALVRRVVTGRGVNAVRWARTARFHPELVLETLQAELERACNETAAARAWWAFGGALRALSRSHPHRLLDLWETFGPHSASPMSVRACWPELLRADPDRTAALVRRALETTRTQLSAGVLPAAFLRRARLLRQQPLELVARSLATNVAGLAMLLEALPPSRRAGVFSAALQGADTASVLWPDRLLAALPHSLRHAEVRRMLGLAQVQREPARRLALTAWLPVDEALPALVAEARAGKGEERARGWALRITCNASNRCGLGETLDALQLLKNEQDPVRLAAYGALARVPIVLFEPGHVKALLQLVTFAVKARDTSPGTRAALQQVAQRLLLAWAHEPSSPLFQLGLEITLKLAEQRPVLTFPALAHGLRRGTERALVDALLPWFRKEVAREINANVIQLASALGRRARRLPDLQQLLEEIVFTARPVAAGERSRAVVLWLDDPRERDVRVRRLLDWDESGVTLAPIWSHLHLRRQDWLDPFIQGRLLSGRFGSEKAGWLFPARSRFGTWLPRQEKVFALTLRRVMTDTGHHVATRAGILRTLAALPATTRDDLEPMTRHEDVLISEAALGALVWLDEPASALPILLDHLDSDRARVAMYAMPRLARIMPDAALLATLRELLARPNMKITVQKEVLRLLGSVSLPGAAELLNVQWNREGLHRDVRVALLHAARRRLDDPVSWKMLQAAVAHPEREVARAVLETSVEDVPPPHRAGYAALTLGLAHHPSAAVRKRLMEHLCLKIGWGALAPARAALTASETVLSPALDAPWTEATRALAALAVWPDATATVVETIERLAERAQRDPLAVAPEQDDMPAQRRLSAICKGLVSVQAGDRGRTAAARTGALEKTSALKAWLWSERVELTLADLPVGAAAHQKLCELASQAPTAIEGSTLAGSVALWAKDESRVCESVKLFEIVDALLKAQADWPALGAAIAAGDRFGWGRDARERLAILRQRPQTAAQARRVTP